MLRGEPRPDIDTFARMEEMYSKDVDAWLGNLYVEISLPPRMGVSASGENVDE